MSVLIKESGKDISEKTLLNLTKMNTKESRLLRSSFHFFNKDEAFKDQLMGVINVKSSVLFPFLASIGLLMPSFFSLEYLVAFISFIALFIINDHLKVRIERRSYFQNAMLGIAFLTSTFLVVGMLQSKFSGEQFLTLGVYLGLGYLVACAHKKVFSDKNPKQKLIKRMPLNYFTRTELFLNKDRVEVMVKDYLMIFMYSALLLSVGHLIF